MQELFIFRLTRKAYLRYCYECWRELAMKRNPKITAINHFKKVNRRKTLFCGRMRLAYYVPGTRENGTYQMLLAQLRP